MRLLRGFRALLLAVLLASLPAAAQVNLNFHLLNPGAEVFRIGDLDFINSGQVPNYFNATLSNTDPEMTFHLLLRLQVFYNGTQIAVGFSNAFYLAPGISVFFTSQELSLGTVVIPGDERNVRGVRLVFDESDIDLNAVLNLQDQILASGRAPSGTYLFIMSALEADESGNPLPRGQVYPDQSPEGDRTIIITNPTSLNPLFPGRSVSETIIVEISTTFPYFQWYSDVNPASAAYKIFVYQKFPEDVTVQDVLNHPPVLRVENLSQNFLQYPLDTDPSAVGGNVIGPIRPLEAGKIYYWFVQTVIPTSTGSITLESDVFRFKITDLAQGNNNASEIIAFLQQILGPNFYPVLQQLQEAGFEPNGNINLDGGSVEMNDLLELLNKILQGKVKVQNVEVFEG